MITFVSFCFSEDHVSVEYDDIAPFLFKKLKTMGNYLTHNLTLIHDIYN